jgi:hypothetical protein
MRSSRAFLLFRNTIFALCALTAAAGASLVSNVANATTVATFEWVSTSSSGGITTPTGTLTLSLPDSITSQTFNTGSLGSSANALALLTGFSYTYGNGLSVGLSNLNLTSSSVSPAQWITSYSTNTNGVATGFYLLAGFQLNGSKVFPGDSRAANFQLSNSAGIQNGPAGPSIIGAASNNMTPFVGPATVDAGYWRMTSFQTGVSPVPLPAALPLLLSGLLGFGGFTLRRRR